MVHRFSLPPITTDTLGSGIVELTEGEKGRIGEGVGEHEKKWHRKKEIEYEGRKC